MWRQCENMKRGAALVQPVRTLQPAEWDREARDAVERDCGPCTPRRGPPPAGSAAAAADWRHHFRRRCPRSRRHKSFGGEMGRFFKDLNAAPDRGKSFYQQERQRQHLASLVQAGRWAQAGAGGCWSALMGAAGVPSLLHAASAELPVPAGSYTLPLHPSNMASFCPPHKSAVPAPRPANPLQAQRPTARVWGGTGCRSPATLPTSPATTPLRQMPS